MESIIDLHHDIMAFLIFIVIGVSVCLLAILSYHLPTIILGWSSEKYLSFDQKPQIQWREFLFASEVPQHHTRLEYI